MTEQFQLHLLRMRYPIGSIKQEYYYELEDFE